MRAAMIFSFRPLAFATVFLITGCNTVSEINPFSKDVIDVACPTIGILKEAEKLTRFRPGGGRESADVLIEARISRAVGKCRVTQSKLIADVSAGIEVLADSGPEFKESKAELEYFVAVTGPDGEIVSRESFSLTLEFEKDSKKARTFDYLSFSIPNATPDVLKGYRVFFGIQMTRDELANTLSKRQSQQK